VGIKPAVKRTDLWLNRFCNHEGQRGRKRLEIEPADLVCLHRRTEEGLGIWDWGFRDLRLYWSLVVPELETLSCCHQMVCGFILQKRPPESRAKMQGVAVKRVADENRRQNRRFGTGAADAPAVDRATQRRLEKRLAAGKPRRASFARGEAMVAKFARARAAEESTCFAARTCDCPPPKYPPPQRCAKMQARRRRPRKAVVRLNPTATALEGRRTSSG